MPLKVSLFQNAQKTNYIKFPSATSQPRGIDIFYNRTWERSRALFLLQQLRESVEKQSSVPIQPTVGSSSPLLFFNSIQSKTKQN